MGWETIRWIDGIPLTLYKEYMGNLLSKYVRWYWMSLKHRQTVWWHVQYIPHSSSVLRGLELCWTNTNRTQNSGEKSWPIFLPQKNRDKNSQLYYLYNLLILSETTSLSNTNYGQYCWNIQISWVMNNNTRENDWKQLSFRFQHDSKLAQWPKVITALTRRNVSISIGVPYGDPLWASLRHVTTNPKALSKLWLPRD